MAENKLTSELSGITISGLTITGNTIYDNGITTFKLPLGELVTYIGTVDGDFATTGSNVFNGSQTINGSIIISGSGNIYTTQESPSSGMTRHMSSYNTFIGTETVPQITSSMSFSPTISYNIGATQGGSFKFYGPNSTSSSWSIMSNLIMGGQGVNFGSLLNPMNKLSGSVQVSANIINNGTINVKGYGSNLTGPYNITGNLINGGLLNLNSYSSSLNFNSNNVNALVDIDNSHRPISGSRTASLSPRVNFNMLYGNNHKLIFSGSNSSTGQTKSFNWNLLQGEFITASIGDGDSSNIASTAIVGNSLVVTGSSTIVDGDANYTINNTHGSAFFGRFNSLQGNKSKTAETVFAVGTGTQSSRRTGFLIDSGSNVRIDGTLVIGDSGSLHTDNPEILHVQNSGSFNVAHFEGDSDTYLQLNIKNTSSSAGASSDFVATADNGTEDLHYVNMGINSSGFDNEFSVGYQNDAYLINRGRDLYIGSLDGPDYNHTHVHLFSSNSWQNPQISIISDGKIGFNTGSVTTGFTYEFSGSIKVNDDIKIDGSVTSSYFVGDGGQLINLSNIVSQSLVPNNPPTGSIYFDTYDNSFWGWNGQVWRLLDSGPSSYGIGINLDVSNPSIACYGYQSVRQFSGPTLKKHNRIIGPGSTFTGYISNGSKYYTITNGLIQDYGTNC